MKKYRWSWERKSWPTLTISSAAANGSLPYLFTRRRNHPSRREGGGECLAVARVVVVDRRWNTKARRCLHPLAGNNVTNRLPVRHRHVHALDWLRQFRVSQQPLFFLPPSLISTNSRLLRKRSHTEISFQPDCDLNVSFKSCSDRLTFSSRILSRFIHERMKRTVKILFLLAIEKTV